MSNVTPNQTPVNNNKESAPEFAWGASAIGRAIGISQRQAYNLLIDGQIKSAQKRGLKWVAHIPALRREFGAE
jgi:hypothetical protein